ncbi:hypothetical protein H4Q26_005349 [Puccinia striiformis f. sp. tritici PST-130]|nr:hypothetical protein H4Q26_005349 [Puccinia striiformis f. sp. tritici PST-130]
MPTFLCTPTLYAGCLASVGILFPVQTPERERTPALQISICKTTSDLLVQQRMMSQPIQTQLIFDQLQTQQVCWSYLLIINHQEVTKRFTKLHKTENQFYHNLTI